MVRRALLLSYLGNYGTTAIHMVAAVVLARLLTPAEIGIFSVGAVIAGFAGSLRELGVSGYIAQERDLTPTRIATAFGIALLMGLCFAVLVAAASVPVGWFYDEHGVTVVLLLLAGSFLIVPFGSITQALLGRELEYAKLAVIRIAGAAAQLVVSVVAAWLGQSYLSLAYGVLAGAATSAVVSVAYRPRNVGWRPSLVEARRVLPVGARTSVVTLLYDLADGAPDLVLGRVHGFATAAQFSRAAGFVNLIYQLVARAAVPVALSRFAQLHRQGSPVGPALLESSVNLMAIVWPGLAVLALLADEVVPFLFGAQWTDAAHALPVICLAIGLRYPTTLVPQALLALGRSEALLKIEAWVCGTRIAFICAAAAWGLQALAWSLVAASMLQVLIWSRPLSQQLGISGFELALRLRRSGLVAVASAVPVAAMQWLLRTLDAPTIVHLIVGSVTACVGFVVSLRLLRHPLYSEVEFLLAQAIKRLRH